MTNTSSDVQPWGGTIGTSDRLRTLKLGNPHNDGGEYGLIVVSDDLTRAIKLFHRIETTEEHAVTVFESEVQAYEIASSDPHLKAYVPDFYGVVTIDKVIDQKGFDISSSFFCSLAYEMGFVAGPFDGLRKRFSEKYPDLAQLFRNAGINYTSDVSVTYDKLGKLDKIVDFALERHVLWLEGG